MKNTNDWLNRATRGLEHHPDWPFARRELAEHLEDRRADLMRIFPGIPPEEAEVRTLRAMGDPAEVDRALTRAHSRVLGTAYWLLRGLVLALGAGGVLFLPGYLWMTVIPLL